MKKVLKRGNEIVVYKSKSGEIKLRGYFGNETIWAMQADIADIFETDRSVITKHIRNIFKHKELDANSVCAKIAHTASDGKTYNVQVYNLDIILAVGYRINSRQATLFRQWATKVLRRHITKGYTINTSVIKKNYAEFQKAVENIRHLLPSVAEIDNASVVELISAFADTWLSLEAYDEEKLPVKGTTKKFVTLTSERLEEALADFKFSLTAKGEATNLFGAKRDVHAVSGIVGNVMQSIGGTSVYPTVEEKAAHLLYFMVKNHPFVDGNKRSGAYSFIWFLNQAGVLDRSKMTPATLTALTLFVAESDAKHKEKMIRLVLQLLKK